MRAHLAGRSALTRRDALWEDCQNNLGIARLLVREGRPDPLVSTACRMAVETAGRAALEHAGVPFDADLPAALRRLGVGEEIGPIEGSEAGADRLAAAEKAVAAVAAHLRRVAPERHWGF